MARDQRQLDSVARVKHPRLPSIVHKLPCKFGNNRPTRQELEADSVQVSVTSHEHDVMDDMRCRMAIRPELQNQTN